MGMVQLFSYIIACWLKWQDIFFSSEFLLNFLDNNIIFTTNGGKLFTQTSFLILKRKFQKYTYCTFYKVPPPNVFLSVNLKNQICSLQWIFLVLLLQLPRRVKCDSYNRNGKRGHLAHHFKFMCYIRTILSVVHYKYFPITKMHITINFWLCYSQIVAGEWSIC